MQQNTRQSARGARVAAVGVLSVATLFGASACNNAGEGALSGEVMSDGDEPVRRVRAAKKGLHLNGTKGELDETLKLLAFGPDSLSSDDPAQLKKTLKQIARRER